MTQNVAHGLNLPLGTYGNASHAKELKHEGCPGNGNLVQVSIPGPGKKCHEVYKGGGGYHASNLETPLIVAWWDTQQK